MILKNVTTIKAQLPTIDLLRQQLESDTQEPIGETEFRRDCFVPCATGDLVAGFPAETSGFALRLRCEEKDIPGDAIAAELSKRLNAMSESERQKLEDSDGGGVDAIREDIAADLCKRAFVKTKYVTAFYHPDSQLLFVNTTTKGDVNRFMGALIRLAGKVQTTTIHISGIKNGVTRRLVSEIERPNDSEDRPFGAFETGDVVKLKRSMGPGEPAEVVTYKGTWLRNNDELLQQLRVGYEVQEIGLEYPPARMSFRLTHNFHFKGIGFVEVDVDDDVTDFAHHWRLSAMREVEGMVGAVNELCELMEYEQPALDADSDDASDQGEA